MAEPFQSLSEAGGSAVARLFSTHRKSNSIREIEDLLSCASRVLEVSNEKVEEIAKRYGLDLSARLCGQRKLLYRRYLEYCLDDSELSPDETADLVHLKGILRLEDTEVAEVHDEVARVVYGDAIEHVLEDHRLDPEEAEFLRRLRKELQLPDQVAEDLYAEGGERSRRRFLDRTTAYDNVLVAQRDRVLQLTGTSTESIEHAVNQALGEAAHAVSDLRRLELTRIRGEIEDGRVREWKVEVRAAFEKDEHA